MVLHWFEAKQLDRVTNYSTEVEIIREGNLRNKHVYYYCSFNARKKYFGLHKNIKYLGVFHNRLLKAVEFNIMVILKAIFTVYSERSSVFMVNQDLIKHVLPALFLNKFLKRNNKFITDIRTTPTDPVSFEKDMQSFHAAFNYAKRHFDGFSFITPFMENYLMRGYTSEYKSVNWSSGVDVKLFDPGKYQTYKKIKFSIFYHGGISVSRGNLDLIKACEILIAHGYNIELIQIGIIVDKSIETHISKNNINSWCKLFPPVDISEIPKMIYDCDLPVLPFPHFMAWRVSSPIKLMEYMAMGKKVLAPDIECFTDVFGRNDNMVFYFDSTSPDRISTLANAIKKIIDEDLLLDGNFYPEIRKFAESNFTWEKQATKLFEFCDRL